MSGAAAAPTASTSIALSAVSCIGLQASAIPTRPWVTNLWQAGVHPGTALTPLRHHFDTHRGAAVRESGRVRNRRLLVTAAIVLGAALIAIAIVYWAEPAKSLPSFFPGHNSGSNNHHTKHGIASFLVGLACLVFAWFNTGKQKRPARI
jgi:hypothetical protein